MYTLQRDRLTSNLALGLSKEEAGSIVARCYGYTTLDVNTDALSEPIAGLQMLKTPAQIKALGDNVLQMMEFIRMSQNLVMPSLPKVTKGIPQGILIATMWGFPSFEALKTYARQDKIDPTSIDPAEIGRFIKRTGFMPPSQYLLGRDYGGGTLIVHTHADQTSQWIDQELCLGKLEDLQVAVVRCRNNADNYINRYSAHHIVLRQDLSEEHSSYILGARNGDKSARLVVSILPERTYTLEELVASHCAALGEDSVRGRSLIVDMVPLQTDQESLSAGVRLAKEMGINLVVVTDYPPASLWEQLHARVIFGFDRSMLRTDNQEMNSVLIYATPFIGLKRDNMQVVYHSKGQHPVYGVVQLVPEQKPQNAQLLKRIFGARRMG